MENKVYKLADISTNMFYGSMPKKEDIIESGYPIFSGYRIVGYSKKINIKERTLIVVARGVGGTGDVKIAPKESFLTNLSIAVKLRDDIVDLNYLYYYLNIQGLRYLDTGAAQSQITINNLKSHKVVLPNLQYQKRIANILLEYDNLIENNNNRIIILEQMAEETYKNFFAYHKIKNNSEEKRLGEILDFQRGISYSSEEIDCEEGINLINLKNINAYGGFRRDGTKKYDGKYKESQIVKSGDLIMGVTDMTQDRRTVGSVALIPTIEGISVISADLVKVNSKIDNTFLYAMFKYGNLSKYISQFANGANVLHLKPQAISNIKVQLPNIELINSYVKLVKPIIDEIDKLNLQNDNLVIQRDLLLPRLMSGKLEVK